MLLTIVAALVLAWIYSLQTKINALQRRVESLYSIVDELFEEEEDLQQESKLEQKMTVVSENISETMALTSSEGGAEAPLPNSTGTLKQQAVTQDEAIKEAPLSKEIEPINPAKKEPSFSLTTWIIEYFTHGNILVRVGGVILFFGLAFLVKYAAEHSHISMEVRLLSVSFIAVALIILGWILRKREGGYGLILQGLGVALLYLVIYGAAKFFSLLSLDSAFVLMFGVVIVGSLLSVVEDALPLALFSTTAGFLVPILTSSGDGSHIVLFSYYALLNAGIFVMAWYRSWRILNLSGFVFTFIIATAWGVLRYDHALFATTEPFLILYFVMYLGIAILFTLKHPFRPHNFVDATLVFGLPLVAFPLQLELIEHIEKADALSAVVLGILYTLLWILFRGRERSDLLAQSFLALGVVFYTIAIPYYFDTDVAASLWAMESAGIIWISLKQSRVYSRYFGELLLIFAIITYPLSIVFDTSDLAFINTIYLGYLIVVIATLVSSYLLDRYREQLSLLEKRAPVVFMVLGTLFLLVAGANEIDKFDIRHMSGMLIYLVVITLVVAPISWYIGWKKHIDALQLYFSIGGFFIYGTIVGHHFISPLSGIGIYALGGFFFLHYLLLHFIGKEWKYNKHLHMASLWLITLLAMIEISYRVELWRDTMNWIVGSWAIAPLLLATAILSMRNFGNLYRVVGVGGLVAILFIWEWISFGLSADLTPWTYMPILNPLDMLEILSLALIGYWIYSYREQFSIEARTLLGSTMAIMLTLLSSVILSRAVHHFRDIAYTSQALWDSLFLQVGLSLLWSILAIVLMLLSMRYKSRPLWIFGFALLIIVVMKLFVIELASNGTIERIVSFIAVGTLLLLVGYFAPLPPAREEKERG